MPSYQVKQSSTAYPLVFLMVDSADHITGKTGLSPTVTISKAGAAFGSPSGAVTEIGSGWYKVAGNATDSGTLGPLALHATASGADPSDTLYEVVAHDVQDSVRLGLSALPNAAAASAGGLPTSGTGANQIDLDSSGRINIGKALGTAVTLDANNVLNVSAKYWAGTAITATSIPVATAAGASGGLVIAGSNAAITFTGTAASGATPATAGMTLVGGAASTSSGGVSAAGLSCTGGAGAASTNGAAAGLSTTGGGTTTVSGGQGLLMTATGNESGTKILGAGTGHGAYFLSGTGSTGSGMRAESQATNGTGFVGIGIGTGHGLSGTGGATSGHGFLGTGQAGGAGMKLSAGASAGAAGLILAGASSANALLISCTSSTAPAISVSASHRGLDIASTDISINLASTGSNGINISQVGATSDAISVTAGATSGNALKVTTTSGHGFDLSGVAGVSKFGIKGTIDGAITSSGLATPTNITSATGIDVTKWSGTTVATPNTAGVPVVDTRELIRQGTAQSTGNSTTAIKLDAGASATTNFYKYMRIQVISGTGAPQAALCTAYDGTTKIATVAPAWPTAPDNTSVFQIFPAQADLETIVGAAVSTSTAQLGVNVVTNADKTGYSLTQAFPSNFSSLAITAGGAVTVGTNNDKTGYSIGSGGITSSSFAAGAIDASAIATDAIGSNELAASAVSEIVTAVWTDLLASSDFSTASSIGKLLKDDIDATISSRLASASYTAPTNLTAAQIATGVWQDTTAGDFTVASSIGKSILNGVTLGTGLTINALTTNNDKTGYALTSGERNSIADAVLTRDVVNVEGTANDHSLCYVVLASSEWAYSGTTLTVKKTDGSTTFATKTGTNTAGADPVRGMN